tara:strand:- start:209 stop:967 length:759 start_codon:yes stop_codon:yes gene_type:complete
MVNTLKTIILCGGRGSRLGDVTKFIPKPLTVIQNKPILTHIMNHFQNYGFNNFILALGYKGHKIKEYFVNYDLYNFDTVIDNNKIEYINSQNNDLRIELIDTGLNTLTGGRLLKLRDYVDETFMLTYGDGVSNVNLRDLLKFHMSHGKIATVTAVKPIPRFGALSIDQNNKVINFSEKNNISEQSWINGGFFVFNKKIFDYLVDDLTILEQEPMSRLVKDEQLMSYKHSGFWQCLDTQRDIDQLSQVNLESL